MPPRRLKFEVLSPRLVLDGQPVQVLGYTTSTHELPGLDSENRLEIVDLNQDGLLDLVAFSFSPEKSQTVHTLLRTETKDFEPMQSWEAGQPIREIEFGDVNGDGFPDILSGTGKTIVALLNQGTNETQTEWQGFSAPTTTSFELDINSVRAGDLDGDGLDDLIVLRQSTYTLTSNGDGTFGDPIRYGASGDFEVADVNRDGHLDFVNLSWAGYLRVFLNDGTGVLESSSRNVLGYEMPGIADLDSDGNPDVVLIDESGLISFGIGQGDGTFDDFNGQNLRTDNGRRVGILRVGDINHDGIPDLVSRRGGDPLHPWDSPGGMFFWIGLGNHRFRHFGGTSELRRTFEILDFDHTGQNQIVVLTGNQIRIVEVNESFNSAIVYDSSIHDVQPPQGVAGPVDVTGDGIADVVTGGLTPNGISITLESNGKVTEHLVRVPTEYRVEGSIGFNDVDKDGVFEVIADHAKGFAVISLKGGENKIADSREGDFNEDSSLGFEDIRALWTEVNEAVPHPDFDLTGDAAVDERDVDYWLTELAQTRRGDANLDGKVGFQDFLSLANNFGRDDHWISWPTGDFNGDGRVDFADFLILARNFGFRR